MPTIPTAAAKKNAKANKATNGKPTERKERLPKAQVRILTVLSKLPAGSSLAKPELAKRADVPETHIVGFTMVKYASKRTPALAELGWVKVLETEKDGKKERTFAITATGKKALAKALAEIAARS